MTREEKIICKMYLNDLDRTHGCNEYKLLMQLLEQQPCEDCVSKAEVFNILSRNYCGYSVAADGNCVPGNYREGIYDEIKALPPVTPTRKKGKWIKVKNGRGGHECSICQMYAPSYQSGDEYLSRFCPNCGAEMESEE